MDATRHTGVRDDRIEWITKLLSAAIVPFLVVAAVILLGAPTETDRLFAWPIAPPVTAMLLGSTYLGGAYFFIRVVVEDRWHHVTLGFPPVVAFASVLGITTILHWDRFTHGHVSFATWAVLYFTTPFLVLVAWLRNRRRDPGAPAPGEAILGRGVATSAAVIGLGATTVAAVLFVWPAVMIERWPWTLTPLTARVLASLFALQGVVAILAAFDRRWSAIRVIAQTALVMLASVAISISRGWADIDHSGITAWALVAGLAGLIGAWAAVYLAMERRPPERETAR